MEDMAVVFGRTSSAVTKVERYGWTITDKPGKLCHLDKNLLNVDSRYQRNFIENKVKTLAANWSWVACGVIVVAKRPDGTYWVMDGQHRVVAAKRRADIMQLPCIVFSTADVKQEANGFLNANTGRKPVSSLDKFRASVAVEDETTVYVDALFKKLGITPSATTMKPLSIKSVAWALKSARTDRAVFERVITVAAELCSDCPLYEIVLDALFYIQSNSDDLLNDKRFLERLKSLGVTRLVDGAKRSAAYYAKGGARVWAIGMLEEINRGLRNRFSLTVA